MCMWCVAESYSQMNGQAGAGAWHESASSSASSGGSAGSVGSGGSAGSGGSGELLQLRRAAKVRAGGQMSPHLCSYAEADASRLGGLDLPGSIPGSGRICCLPKNR